MNLIILTPDGVLFDEIIKSVIIPGEDGPLGILPRHVPLIVILKRGIIKVKDGHNFQINSGLARIERDCCVIMTQHVSLLES